MFKGEIPSGQPRTARSNAVANASPASFDDSPAPAVLASAGGKYEDPVKPGNFFGPPQPESVPFKLGR